ncbi:sensor histidine kinase [Novisyntrophococcus fermenticellae]|uniref:sensor histidine kinase n=1 Tax=Novisyntrophococcus fermenticellae TaxID=2068655 RepID=UPI001E2FC62C|nr:HAMP domain-containing sensor histidine kinase [Novisyntrophococcus fermenticellae]
MLKKLRKKFVITNMVFVTAVILTALVVMCISSYRRFYADSIVAIDQTLSRNLEDLKPAIDFRDRDNNPPPRSDAGGVGRIFVFTVMLEKDSNTVSGVNDSGIQVDIDTAQKAADAALSLGKSSGTIQNMDLRFKIDKTDAGIKIAFADITNEKNSMRSLIIISVLIFFLVLLTSFFISVYLSKRALSPVQKAWVQQHQFVADASHELKTPLTVILANLDILKSHTDHTIAAEKKWIDNTEEEAIRMKELLQDLLFLAREDADSAPPAPHISLNFSQIVWECILPFESVTYEQKTAMTEDIQDDIFVSGNEKQLKQLLMILLDNACKYAKNGTIHVTLGQKHEHTVLRVKNTGPLIAKEDLEHIFERFYRASKSRSRDTGGYGLGLSIAQTIVYNHKGSIKATSTAEDGTTFTVTFPLLSI